MSKLNEYKKALAKIEKNPNDRIGILGKLLGVGIGGVGGGAVAAVTGHPAFFTFFGVGIWVVAAPVGMVTGAAVAGGVLAYGVTKLISSGVRSDIKTQENIKKLREEIRKNSINHISGTEGDISKLSRVYQELISLNAISEETVKNLLESIKSNNIDFTFTYKTALELLDQKQNNIKELK